MRKKPEKQKYELSPDVEAVAKPLIRDHHQHIINNDIHIVYLFCTKVEKKNGKECFAMVRKHSGINAYLYREAMGDIGEFEGDTGDNEFFSITVWKTAWYAMLKEARQKQALIMHELCHIWSEESEDEDEDLVIKKKLVPEDLMEFRKVAELFGPWLPDISDFMKALERYEEAQTSPQIAMPLETSSVEAKKVA